MQSLGSIPEDLGLGDVFEVDVGMTLPAVLLGRAAVYDELIWDADGGFAAAWGDKSSITGNSTDGYTAVLGRRGTSGAGLALFAAYASGGGGGGDGDATSIKGIPVSDLSAGTDNQVLTLESGHIVLRDAAAGAGDVVGPSGAVTDRVATFDGTTGKLIKDGGVTIAAVEAAAVASALSSTTKTAVYNGHANRIIQNTATTWTDIDAACPDGWVDDNMVNTARSGSQVTVSVTGWYHVSLDTVWFGQTCFTNVRVLVNGTTKLSTTFYGSTLGNALQTPHVHGNLLLAAGDVVRFQYANSGSGSAGYVQGAATDSETERWVAQIHMIRVSS